MVHWIAAFSTRITRSCYAKKTFCQLQHYKKLSLLSYKIRQAQVQLHLYSSDRKITAGPKDRNDTDVSKDTFVPPMPQLDFDFLCDTRNADFTQSNIETRKGVGDIHKVVRLDIFHTCLYFYV